MEGVPKGTPSFCFAKSDFGAWKPELSGLET